MRQNTRYGRMQNGKNNIGTAKNMMNDTTGRSVRLFLVDGNPTGLVTAEIVNWSGHVLSGSRSSLPAFLRRPELDRTGIYFLFGRNPDDPDQPVLYIGESDNVRKRLAQHNKDDAKNFWERTCVVTSKDLNITKAHARVWTQLHHCLIAKI